MKRNAITAIIFTIAALTTASAMAGTYHEQPYNPGQSGAVPDSSGQSGAWVGSGDQSGAWDGGRYDQSGAWSGSGDQSGS